MPTEFRDADAPTPARQDERNNKANKQETENEE
jgi:hypothetical protein